MTSYHVEHLVSLTLVALVGLQINKKAWGFWHKCLIIIDTRMTFEISGYRLEIDDISYMKWITPFESLIVILLINLILD